MAEAKRVVPVTEERAAGWLAEQPAFRNEHWARGAAGVASPSGVAGIAAPPVITLARQIGCRADAIAHALAADLGPRWQVWDHEIIEAVARSARTRTETANALDERLTSAIDRFLRDLAGLDELDPWAFEHHLARVLASVAQQGYKILVGRGAYLLLPSALHVRVRARMESRIAVLMAEAGMDAGEAARHIREADRERDAFIGMIARRHPETFDVTLWTDRLPIDAAVAAIASAARAVFGEDV